MPQLAGPLDPEEAGPLPPLERTAALQQLPLPHHPLRPLAVDRPAELRGGERGDHPVAVGRVRSATSTIAASTGSAGGRRCGGRPRLRRPVDRLPADLQHARHGRQGEAPRDQFAGTGDAHAHSHPRNASPAISSS